MAEMMPGESRENKEIMDKLLEIKDNMNGITQEEKSRAVALYENLSSDEIDELGEGQDVDAKNLLEKVKARIGEIKEEFAAHGEDMLNREEQNSPQQEAAA